MFRSVSVEVGSSVLPVLSEWYTVISVPLALKAALPPDTSDSSPDTRSHLPHFLFLIYSKAAFCLSIFSDTDIIV